MVNLWVRYLCLMVTRSQRSRQSWPRVRLGHGSSLPPLMEKFWILDPHDPHQEDSVDESLECADGASVLEYKWTIPSKFMMETQLSKSLKLKFIYFYTYLYFKIIGNGILKASNIFAGLCPFTISNKPTNKSKSQIFTCKCLFLATHAASWSTDSVNPNRVLKNPWTMSSQIFLLFTIQLYNSIVLLLIHSISNILHSHNSIFVTKHWRHWFYFRIDLKHLALKCSHVHSVILQTFFRW